MLTTPPLRAAVLCSGRAPGLAHLLTNAAGRGHAWDIACCLTSEETFAEEALAVQHGVPVIHHPIRRFYAERDPQARLGDRRLRADYDRKTLESLGSHSPDVILLAGYLWMVTEPILAAFEGRLLNVHHADLWQRDERGGPRYPGLRAVRDAIAAGEHETRSTLHLVTEQLDRGPALLRSPAFLVSDVAKWALAHGEDDVFRHAVWAHQEWMLRAAFGPLMEQALDLLAACRPRVATAQEVAA